MSHVPIMDQTCSTKSCASFLHTPCSHWPWIHRVPLAKILKFGYKGAFLKGLHKDVLLAGLQHKMQDSVTEKFVYCKLEQIFSLNFNKYCKRTKITIFTNARFHIDVGFFAKRQTYTVSTFTTKCLRQY